MYNVFLPRICTSWCLLRLHDQFVTIAKELDGVFSPSMCDVYVLCQTRASQRLRSDACACVSHLL